nr:probable AMP deaminase isoform X1 [Ipomoea trifida]
MDSSSSSAPASKAHLALAAFFGASVMAISAFYLHRRSLDQALDRIIKLLRHQRPLSSAASAPESGTDDEAEADDVHDRNIWSHQSLPKTVAQNEDDSDEKVLRKYRVSSSMPNARLANDWMDEDAKLDRPAQYGDKAFSAELMELSTVPSGLPPLRTDNRDGENQHNDGFDRKMRVGSVGRQMTPKSSLIYSLDGDLQDDEETEFTQEDIEFLYENDNSPNVQNISIIESQAENGNQLHGQPHKAITDDAKTNIDHHDRKVDAVPGHIKGTDNVFVNGILPQVTTMHEPVNIEEEEVLKMIRESLYLRKKYVFKENIAPWMKATSGESNVKQDPFQFVPCEATGHHFKMVDGVVRVYASENDTEELFPVANSTTFFTDMHHLLKVMAAGSVRTACHHRLRLLEEKFRLHLLVNADREFLAQKSAPHRDFYNIRKVDTHVHHSACMNQKHLLRFIKSKLEKEPDEVVIFRDGQYLTLKEVFESLDLTGHDLNVDLLDVHADKSTFHRFDKFNLKYNPCGQSRLREIFLKQDNLIQGRFLGEVTKEVLSDLEASKYQMAEYRISVYGRKQSEWDQLASWFINNGIYSENAVWLIQLPRLYNVYRSMGTVTSFQNILDNVFIPLFEVTVDPNSHPQLHLFLMQVVGFDIVDDESKPERRPTKHMPTPAEWTNVFNPAFSYYAYYCYANLFTLNKLRESKGLPTIRFRPHCGEAGEIDHLAAGFLLCHNISHGINLRKSPVLQYLYFLAQIGLAMSPLSNNSLFLDYHRNPFYMFFQRGLNVSLSTDDPLQIHLTKEPLVEEYSVAAKVWKLNACDLCEIARNSVYQSGFSHADKLHWLGNQYYKRGPGGNDIHKTNVPNMRISFRHDTWMEEILYVYRGKAELCEEVDH